MTIGDKDKAALILIFGDQDSVLKTENEVARKTQVWVSEDAIFFSSGLILRQDVKQEKNWKTSICWGFHAQISAEPSWSWKKQSKKGIPKNSIERQDKCCHSSFDEHNNMKGGELGGDGGSELCDTCNDSSQWPPFSWCKSDAQNTSVGRALVVILTQRL